jgi:hypothetical protein
MEIYRFDAPMAGANFEISTEKNTMNSVNIKIKKEKRITL